MSVGPFVVEIILTFTITATVLQRYGNWYHHHIIVTLSVLIAWYFSMLIVFVLPLDVSNTLYETCLKSQDVPILNIMNDSAVNQNLSATYHAIPSQNTSCHKPWSYIPSGVFTVFWRVVYWTSQVLTWLILPIMQSYTKAGDFTFGAKLRSALIDNAIYYGSYLLIVGILLLYIALRPDVFLDWSKMRTIAATASNTWGLFWLILLLGFGLVEVPRSLWRAACTHYGINHAYFKAAKLRHEQAEAQDHLNDLLQSLRALSDSMSPTHPLRPCIDIIEQKIPAEVLHRIRGTSDSSSVGSDLPPHADVPSEKALVRLHKQLLKALQHERRVQTQWTTLMSRILFLEDAHRSNVSVERLYQHSEPPQRPSFINRIYTPRIEWYCQCVLRRHFLRALAVCCAIVSAAVVWSELTFFVKSPPLTLFANLVNLAHSNNNYFAIEMISSLTMAYIAFCAYSTIFKVRVLNLYYLASNHLTDEYSLIFSGMMLCRLTPPMCLNFLSLIHMDSHIIDKATEETHYTQIMGHMDVIGIISDGFNVYFPMMIVALCLATYYDLGSRFLSALGFQQFLNDQDLTTDLIEEGRTIASRERRRRTRVQDSAQRRTQFTKRFGVGESTSNMYRSARQRAENLVRPLRRGSSGETLGAQMELLGEVPPDYDAANSSATSVLGRDRRRYENPEGGKPDLSLFDDV